MSEKKEVFSVCGMCTVRCPIQVDVEDNEATFIQGNPFSPLKGALCARGAAGFALEADDERPQYPMIRDGERGEGKWRRASWDEALDYVAERIKTIVGEHGAKSVMLSDRGGPFVEMYQAFIRGLGSPNYFNHDVSCARNVQHACKSVTGYGRTELVYDYANTKHLVLQTRNIYEAINVAEVNSVLDGKAKGAKLTVIDVRASVSASKADYFHLIKPGTDYAFNLAVINVLMTQKLFDKEFADMWIADLDQLASFIKPYTPEWAETQTGVKAEAIRALAKDLAAAAPQVIYHPGWMTARYADSFYVCRSAYIINALLGAIGAKGGLPLASKPGDVGKKGLAKLPELFPKPADPRCDGVGTELLQFDAGPGLLHLGFEAVESEKPYPVKAYFAVRHDPLMAMPDPEAIKKKWEKLELLVSMTFSWSDTAWHSDVVLPMSPYLSRESIIASKGGLKPSFFVRFRALKPRFDTKADWEIIAGLAKRLGLDKLAFDSIEELWNHQLAPTGYQIEDFKKTGMVSLASESRYLSRSELSFPTASGKVEMVNPKWEKAGCPSLKPYEAPSEPPEGKFRVIFGRCGLHTQGHTVNNTLLGEQMIENPVWINAERAKALGIKDGAAVKVSGSGYAALTKAFVTEFIHPQAAFMVHGFGHKLPVESRALGKGVSDNLLMGGGNAKWDKAGGGLAMQEHFISVEPA